MTVPSFPVLTMLITPVHWQLHVHSECSAGSPSIVTLDAPGVHGLVVAGTHGAGVRTPPAAAVAAATAGFDVVPHMPKDGMLSIGWNAWMVPARVSQVTGVPVGRTVSGTGVGGIASEQVIIASLETSGGIRPDSSDRLLQPR